MMIVHTMDHICKVAIEFRFGKQGCGG